MPVAIEKIVSEYAKDIHSYWEKICAGLLCTVPMPAAIKRRIQILI